MSTVTTKVKRPELYDEVLKAADDLSIGRAYVTRLLYVGAHVPLTAAQFVCHLMLYLFKNTDPKYRQKLIDLLELGLSDLKARLDT